MLDGSFAGSKGDEERERALSTLLCMTHLLLEIRLKNGSTRDTSDTMSTIASTSEQMAI